MFLIVFNLLLFNNHFLQFCKHTWNEEDWEVFEQRDWSVMICWEVGKTGVKYMANFWAVLGLRGYHTALLVEWFPKFQRKCIVLYFVDRASRRSSTLRKSASSWSLTRSVLCFKCQNHLSKIMLSHVWYLLKNLVQKTHFLKQFLPLTYYISFYHMRLSSLSLHTYILCRSSSNPDMHTVGDEDDEVNKLARGLDRTSSMRAGTINVIFSCLHGSASQIVLFPIIKTDTGFSFSYCM